MGAAKQANKLIYESSPYLKQHAYNPVNWYPWGDEAFEKAGSEDKPVFLSIGYSTCHWCHVMAHESFEDEEAARILNEHFVPIKVDREERPDIDNIYMRACQAFTGGGGWPMSIFLTSDRKPFFAGTYFPKDRFIALLEAIRGGWPEIKAEALRRGDELIASLAGGERGGPESDAPVESAVNAFRQTHDSVYGGFGRAPKFPSPHNLMLLIYTAPELAEKTLTQMYRGGIFDHIGFGFSRYSTDNRWLVPHFEKMLYDNALLAIAYLIAHEVTGGELYRTVAEKILLYLSRDMSAPGGGFYSAQDADSDGVEGKFYVFTPNEIIRLLGEKDGRRFNEYFNITEKGNFEGRSIPNLLATAGYDPGIDELIPVVYEYRKKRTALGTDRKILTAWNSIAVAAFADAFRILGERSYLDTALKTIEFLESAAAEGDTLYTGVTDGRRGSIGFIDDYAYFVFALLRLHQATQDDRFLKRASELTDKAVSEYRDPGGGFFFSGRHNEKLIFNPKETFDGAVPSGNSVMAYNLSRLSALTGSMHFYDLLKKQRSFMNAEASAYPQGYGFYLYSVLPAKEVVCALERPGDLDGIKIRTNWIFRIAEGDRYPLINGRNTFYVCEGSVCGPPTNEPPE